MNTATDLAGNPLSDLNVGDEIRAMTLFGWFTFIVESFENESFEAYTKNKGLGIWLHQDGEGHWQTECSFNPHAVCKVQIVD